MEGASGWGEGSVGIVAELTVLGAMERLGIVISSASCVFRSLAGATHRSLTLSGPCNPDDYDAYLNHGNAWWNVCGLRRAHRNSATPMGRRMAESPTSASCRAFS